LRVVVTTTIVADTVRQVGGDLVEVESLMSAGVDPHKYTPTARDLGKLRQAQLVLFSGLHLEGKMADVLEKPAPGRARGAAVTATLDRKRLRFPAGEHEPDPHVWFDVKLWMACVECARDELSAADPAHAAEFRANAERHLKELAALDAEIRTKIDSIPKEKRVLVTCHDAFAYFGAAYGIEVQGLQGISTAEELGVNDVQKLARFLGQRRIPVVFAETSVPSKGLKAVLDAVESQYGFTVRIIGGDDSLYSDALGEPDSPAGTYIGMVRHNVDTIVKALTK
jgi:manganese/zinc/iron transport system substrate-binding protein